MQSAGQANGIKEDLPGDGKAILAQTYYYYYYYYIIIIVIVIIIIIK
jgi:hypothetical protein